MVGVSATCGLEWFRKFGGVNPVCKWHKVSNGLGCRCWSASGS